MADDVKTGEERVQSHQQTVHKGGLNTKALSAKPSTVTTTQKDHSFSSDFTNNPPGGSSEGKGV